MDLRGLQLIGEGGDHDVFRHPTDGERVLKVPKKKFVGTRRFDEMWANLQDAKRHFGPWLAETAIEKNRVHGYFVHQEKIDGVHIRPDALAACGDSFRALHDAHRVTLEKEGLGLDFFGLEGGWRTVLGHIRHLRGSIYDVLAIRPLLRTAAVAGNVFPLLHSFRTAPEVWSAPGPINPELSNVLQKRSSPTQVRIVDVDLLRGGKSDVKPPFRTRVVSAFQDYFLERYFGVDASVSGLDGKNVA